MEKISLSPSKISKKPSAIFSLFWKRARGKNSSSISFFLQVFMLLSFFFTYVFPWFLYPCWSKCACTCNIGAFFVNFWIFMSHILISSKKKKSPCSEKLIVSVDCLFFHIWNFSKAYKLTGSNQNKHKFHCIWQSLSGFTISILIM
jgi:hypothetical protein